MTSTIIAKLFPEVYPIHLLHHTKISEIAIPHQIITIIPVGTHVSAVLDTFARGNIISAPVVDDAGKLYGFVDMLDLIALFEALKRKGTPIDQFFSAHVEKAMELPLATEIPVLQGVPRHPIVELPSSTTMAELFERLARSTLHRIAMTEKGKVIAIITQRDILRWIYRNIKAFDQKWMIFSVDKTMAQLGFGGPSDRQVEVITEGTFTCDAFARMRNRNVSCFPVVNDQGKLTHVLSASDLRSISPSNIDLLELPVHFFLTKRPPSCTPVTATLDHNFGEVLRRLDQSGKHRIVITDGDMKPTHVVSLSDIIPLFAVIAPQMKSK